MKILLAKFSAGNMGGCGRGVRRMECDGYLLAAIYMPARMRTVPRRK